MYRLIGDNYAVLITIGIVIKRPVNRIDAAWKTILESIRRMFLSRDRFRWIIQPRTREFETIVNTVRTLLPFDWIARDEVSTSRGGEKLCSFLDLFGKGREGKATVLARGETAGRGGERERESVKGKGEGRRGFPVSGALIHFILCAVKRRSIKVEKSERDSGTRVAEWRGKGSRRRRGGGGSTLGGGDKTRVGTVARRCGHSKVETVFSCLPLRTDNGEARGFNVNAGNPFLTLSRHQYRNEFFLPHKGALLLRDTRTEFHPVWNHRASSLFARTFELRLRGLTSPSRGSSMIIFE